MKQLLFFCIALFVFIETKSQTSYTWNGSTSTAWNVATNWTPNGVPGGNAGDNVNIVTGSNNCVLNANTTIANITMTSGTLDLGAFTLSPTGNAVFTAGTITHGTLTVNSTTANTAILTNTAFSTTGILNITTGAITLNGGTFGGAVTFNQTGATQTTGNGGATFNSSLAITNSGTNNFRINGNCTYNGATSFINSGTGYFLPELTTGSTYNGNVTLTNTSATQNIRMAYLGNTNFNGNIIVNNTGGGSFTFCEQATATATLANTKTISVGASGFTTGTLTMSHFTQAGATAQNLLLTGSATLTFNNSTTFNGALTVSSPNFYTSNSTFNGVTTITKTDGTSSNGSTGGNTFNNTLTMNYTASNAVNAWFGFAGTTADIYNGDVYVNNSSTDRVLWGVGGTPNTQFNGNLILTQTGSAVGITTAWNTGATCIMAAGKTVSIGAAGFTTGYLGLSGLTQNGTAAINLTTTGSSSIYIGSLSGTTPSLFGGSLTLTAPDIYLRGGTYNSAITVNKTGGTSNHNNGYANTFNSTLTINQQSNSGYFMVSYNANDVYNGNVTITSTGTGGIYIGYSSGTGVPTLAAGSSLLTGAAGFSTGFLSLGGLQQLGGAPVNLTLTGTAALWIQQTSVNCNFSGTFNATAPDIYVRGGTFTKPAYFTKTGGSSNHNNGVQNTFNASCNINQQSNSGYFMLGYNSNEIFNDSIIVSSTGTGGIHLGFTGGTGTPTLAAGKSVFVGSAGFSAGFLSFGAFTQLGSAAMNLTFTGASTGLYFQNASVFGGNITSNTPDVYFNGCTFNGTVNATKTGAGSDAGSGGNTFQQTSSFTNTGAGYLLLGNGTPDIWNADVTFNNSGSDRILPAYNSANNQFNGNIIVSNTGSGAGIEFCSGATASAILAALKNIQIGAAGFNTGYLHLYRFTQLGSAASNLTFTGANTVINIGPSAVIGGDFTVVSPRILLNGATYSGNVNLTKNGAAGEWSNGGNIFNGTTTINQLGAGYFGFANGAPDIYNGDVYVNNNSTERVIFGNSSMSNQFNGNVILTQIGSSLGIAFGWNAATSITMAAGKTISIGGAGFSTGFLQIERFTQLGNAAMNLPLTGSSSLTFGPTAVIGGNVVSTSATLFFNGCTFNGTLDATKNGTTSDASSGGNIFQASSKFTNTGSGYLLLGNGTADTWNGDVTFTNTGSERILPCWNSTGNLFNGNIIFNSTGSSVGINFCGGAVTASATQAAGFNLSIGAAGFSAGYLILQRFTQLGNAATNLTLTSTAGYLQYGPSSVLGGNVTSSSPGLYFNGCTFNGNVNAIKTGASNEGSTGNNIFNGVTTITNAGAGYLQMGNGNLDQFNTTATFNNTGSNSMYIADNSANNIFGGDATFNNTPTANTLIYVSRYSTGTIFNGNIIVTSNNGQGIQFCGGNTTATATLSATKTITVGAGGFSAGTLLLKQFTQVGATPQNLTLTNTSALIIGPSSAFGGNVNFLAPELDLNGCTYSGVAILEQNGATNSGGTGGNIFNGTTTITNSGSAQFLTGNINADQFNSTTTFNNTGSYRFYLANNHTGQTTTFAGNVTFNSNKSASGDAWSFFVCEGTNTNVSFGGNVTINNQGSNQSNCRFLNGTGSTASYAGLLTINVTNTNGSTVMQMGVNGTSAYNGNISVTNNGGSSGIYFNVSAGSSSTLANGQTITTGAGGFNSGGLYLYRFTQVGGTAQSLTLTGTANLTFGPTSAFGGNVTCTSPTLFFNGCTFSGTLNAIKNGSTNDGSIGNNIFNGVTTVTNSGSGYLQFGNGNADQFNSTSTFNNTGSSIIYVADNSSNNIFGGDVTFNNAPTGNTQIYVSRLSTGTIFNGNIIVTSTFGQGVQFCQGNATATATLSATKTISIGAAGFSAGTLLLKQFTQVGATAQSLTLTGTGNLTFGPLSAFGGNVSTVSPTLFFNGCNYTGSVTSTKNGASNDGSIGNNTFGGAFTITNTGAGYFLMGNGNPDVWNSTATFNNYSTAQHMYTAYNSTGNIFNGDVVYNNQPGSNGLWIYPNNNSGGTSTQYNGNISVVNVNGAGIYFGSGPGNATLATGKAISIGTGGFNFGSLIFKNFIQTGATAQSLTTTGTSTIQYAAGSTFNGNLTSTSPSLLFNGTTFNGTINCSKNGTSNDQCTGANIFNGSSTITNSGTGYLRMAVNTTDAYNGNVTFVQTSTGAISPSYNTNCTYAGNITVTSPAGTAITFGSGAAGISTMNGISTTAQTINMTTGKTPVFTQFVMNNTGSGGVTLNTPINISTSLTLTNGLLNTSVTNILTMLNASTAPAITSASATYVNGPMVYQLQSTTATTLNFPIGTSPDCRPVALTAKHTTAATLYNYTAQLFNANPWVAMGSGSPYVVTNMPTSVDTISGVHYWTIARTDVAGTSQPSANLSGNQQITIFFGTNDGVYEGAALTIVKNTAATPAAWIDIGGNCGLGNFSAPQAGSVTSTSSPTAFTSFSSFTLGSKNGGWNPLPIELLNFNAVPKENEVDITWETSTETNNNYFTVERSEDGKNFTELTRVASKADHGTSKVPLSYQVTDANPLTGVSYYRLKQTDYNNNFKYFNIVSVDFSKKSFLTIFPNPASNAIYINASADYQNASVKVMDALGREVLAQNITSTDNGLINTTSLLPGMYYVIIDNGIEINKTKITIQK